MSDMTNLEKAGEKLFRLRDYTPVPIIILGVLFAEPSFLTFLTGIFIALLGESIRLYGVAFIGTISRTRSYSNGELVTSGPFSLLRNPLYLGNLTLSFGLSIVPGIWWLPILLLVFFYTQYIPIVAWEEMKLRRIFGDSYEAYCTTVPNRWFPLLGRFFSFSWCVKPDSWVPAMKSEKRTVTAIVAFLAVMGILFYINSIKFGEFLPLWKFIVSAGAF